MSAETNLQKIARRVSGSTWLEKYEELVSQLRNSGDRLVGVIDRDFNKLKYDFLGFSSDYFDGYPSSEDYDLERKFADLDEELEKLELQELAAKQIFNLILRSEEKLDLRIELTKIIAQRLRKKLLWAEVIYGNLTSPSLLEIGINLPIFDSQGDTAYKFYCVDNLRFLNRSVDEIVKLIRKDQSKLISNYFGDLSNAR